MAVPFSNTKLRVPKGFQNILEGLAREILRNQPANPFEFGNKYFEQLLRVREETGHDPAIHGARLEDRFYNNDSFKSPSVDPSSPQQQEAATKIQTNYRKHVAVQEVDNMRTDEAAEKIQAGFRGYQDRQKFTELKDGEKGQEEEDVDIDLNDPDVEKAAVKIQAGFKGFKARQEIKDIKEQSQPTAKSPEAAPQDQTNAEEEEVDIDLNDPEVSTAALKIQAGFRGHQTRQQLKDKKAKDDQPQTEATTEENVSQQSQDMAGQSPQPADDSQPQLESETKPLQEEAQAQNSEEAEPSQAEEDGKPADSQESEKAEPAPEAADTPADGKDEGTTQAEEEEEVDIDINDPELAQAALKIQSGFRGHLARKEIDAMQESKPDGNAEKSAPEEEAKPTTEEEEKVDIDLNDPETEKAALKIQAGFKGYQTRKDIKAKKEGDQPETTEEQDKPAEDKPAETTEETKAETAEETKADTGKAEEVDIDINDPEVEKAAVKIQASFKGFKTRQDIKAKQESGTETGEGGDAEASGEGEGSKAEDSKAEESKAEESKAEETPAEETPAGDGGQVTEETKEEEKTEATPAEQTDAEGNTEEKTEGEVVDIDLNDPEVAQAATKIQAGFKGFKTRQEIKQKKDSSEDTEKAGGDGE